MQIFNVKNLKKYFNNGKSGNAETYALNGVNFTVDEGEVISIIGPSGSGKSTLLRCLNMLETPTSGEIYFKGTDISKRIGLAFEVQLVDKIPNGKYDLPVGKIITEKRIIDVSKIYKK